MFRLSMLLLLIMGLAPNLWSQDPADGSTAFIEEKIFSRALGENRPILVSLPRGYHDNADRQYPVLYVLNRPENFEWASYLEDVLESKYEIHEMIVVGLPHIGNYAQENSPFKTGDSGELSQRAVSFENFIRTEAVPFIDESYRTKNSRFIIGHSLSGLFVTHLYVQDPTGFNAHIAISPSFHHGAQIIDILEAKFREGTIDEGVIYMTIGGLEHSLIQQQYARMRTVMQEKAPETVYWQMDTLDYTEHRSAGFGGIRGGLTWLYRGESLTDQMMERMSVADVIQHYDTLSGNMGYTIVPRERNLLSMARFALTRLAKPAISQKLWQLATHYYPDSQQVRKSQLLYGNWLSGGISAVRGGVQDVRDLDENMLNSFGYFQLNEGVVEDAIAIFRMLVEYFPRSMNGYDSLGEAYENGGQFGSALEAYETALGLANDQSNTRFQELEIGNIKRIRACIDS